ncbi:hypothetical protein PTKIN_Ptkin14bG0052200 [Pterospermum kingtungense]
MMDEFSNAFMSNLGYVLGNGSRIEFWSIEWISSVILKNRFPKIFALSSIKDGAVKEYGRLINNKWVWNIPLRKRLFSWERQQWNELMAVLNDFQVLSPLKINWFGRGIVLGSSQLNPSAILLRPYRGLIIVIG